MKDVRAMWRLVLLASLAAATRLAATGQAADLSDLPINQWTVLDSLDAMTRVHPRMVWLPEQQQGLLWLNLNYHARAIRFEDHARSWFFSPAKGTWEAKPALFAEDHRIAPRVVGQSCVYLPGLKKILLLSSTSGFKMRH